MTCGTGESGHFCHSKPFEVSIPFLKKIDRKLRGYIPSSGGGLQEPGLIAKTSVVKLDELLRLTQSEANDAV